MTPLPVCCALACALALAGCASPSPAASTKGSTVGRSRSYAASNVPAGDRDNARLEPSFSFLPKSLQANPTLDMTVFTEMTPAGRKLPAASDENPVYYVAQPDGFKQMGASVAGERPPPPIHIDYFVRKALAARGYRSVPSVEVRPSLLILYRWGTHNSLSAESSSDFAGNANSEALERARLVGGNKLVREMAHNMEFGEFLDRDDQKEYLKAQALDSCYFVIVFAYDFDAAVRGEKILYWRTNMTVNSIGVSLRETLPPLIASAAPFLGKETTDTAITTRRLYRREKVEIGPATLVDLDVESALSEAAGLEKSQKGDAKARR